MDTIRKRREHQHHAIIRLKDFDNKSKTLRPVKKLRIKIRKAEAAIITGTLPGRPEANKTTLFELLDRYIMAEASPHLKGGGIDETYRLKAM